MNTQLTQHASKATWFVLYLIIFLGSAGYFITMPAYNSLFLENATAMSIAKNMPLAERRELYGTVMSIAPFLSMFFAPFISRFADRFSRRVVMILCSVVGMIGFAMPVYSIIINSVILLFAGNMINSIGSASQPIAQAVLADNSQGKTKAKLMGFVAVVMTLAMSFGPALGSKLTALYGPQAPFYACLLIAFTCFLLLITVRLPRQAPLTHENPFSLIAPLKRSQPGLLSCLTILFFCQFSWSMYFFNIVFIFKENWNLSVQSETYQYYMMAIGIIMMISLSVLPRFVLSKMPLLVALRVVLSGAAVGMFILAATSNFMVNVIVMVFTVALIALAYPLYVTALSDRTGAGDQGWAMGLCNALMGLSWTLTGYLTSVIVNIDVNLPTFIAALGFVGTIFLAPRQPSSTVEGAQV